MTTTSQPDRRPPTLPDPGPEITNDGDFQIWRHPNYGTVARVKLTCRACPGETYTADNADAIESAQQRHDETAHPDRIRPPF